MTDPLAAALALVGDRWSFLVIREIGLGEDRFESLLAKTGAPRAVLASRLRDLIANDLVATLDYQEPRSRTRQRYVLTASGRALRPVLAALAAWGEDHTSSQTSRVDRQYVDRHRGCGGEVRPRLLCTCGDLVDVPTDVLTEMRSA